MSSFSTRIATVCTVTRVPTGCVGPQRGFVLMKLFGAMTVIEFAEDAVTCASRLPNRTSACAGERGRSVPVIVTTVPTAPTVGEISSMVGAVSETR